MSEPHDPFSGFDEQEPPKPDLEQVERIARLFQTEDGAKLLKDWKDEFCMFPRMNMNPSTYELGFKDGQAHMAKMIDQCIKTVNRVESNE